MVEILSLAEAVNKSTVSFHVLIVSIDCIFEVGLDFEQEPKIRVCDVQSLIDFMLTCQNDLHIQRYGLRRQGLRANDPESLTGFFYCDITALQSSLQSFVRKLAC